MCIWTNSHDFQNQSRMFKFPFFKRSTEAQLKHVYSEYVVAIAKHVFSSQTRSCGLKASLTFTFLILIS